MKCQESNRKKDTHIFFYSFHHCNNASVMRSIGHWTMNETKLLRTLKSDIDSLQMKPSSPSCFEASVGNAEPNSVFITLSDGKIERRRERDEK